MGYNELPNISNIIFRDLSAGWFPGKEHNDIPGALTTPEAPVGSPDCNAVVWFQGALRKMFGYHDVTTPALAGTVTSLFNSQVLSEFVGTIGTSIYSDMNSATPTDITGGLTISALVQPDWVEWQFETDAYIIGVDGANAPWSWTGAGNCALLAGGPPAGRWIQVWQNAVWIARTAAEPSTVFFSDIADPESWTLDRDYKFDAPITGMGTLGDKLVVFKEKSIGIMSGDNNDILVKTDKYINNIGCSGGHTIKNAQINGQEVLLFHSYDGIYAFDGTQRLIKVSNPMQKKYVSSVTADRWNPSLYDQAYSLYWPKYNWWIMALANGGSLENDFMINLDCARPQQDANGLYLPAWPFKDIPIHCMEEFNDELYFGSTNGTVYAFDQAVFNADSVAYDGYFVSKTFDAIEDWVLLESNVMGDQQGVTINVYINADLGAGAGAMDIADMADGAALLGTTFIVGTSVLGGNDFVFAHTDVDTFGRFISFKLQNNTLNEGMVVEEFNIVLQRIGFESNFEEV